MSKWLPRLLLTSSVLVIGCQDNEKVVSMNSSSLVDHKVQPVILAKKEGIVVYRHLDHIYVMGEKMSVKFIVNREMPYAKTLTGGGPMGENLVFEVNPKDDKDCEMLMKKYDETPILVKQVDETFYAFAKSGRLVMVGSKASAENFMKSGEIPYSKTFIGEGPTGQTLVYEIDSKNPDVIFHTPLITRLMKTYKANFN